MVPGLATKDYRPRIVDELLADKLSHAGAAEVRGPKWCGKTETALQAAASAVMMQDPDQAENNLLLADAKPSALLEGEKPLLIDEWQEAPQLWDAVRYAVDRERRAGSYILTGSSTPHVEPKHSGIGRISYLDMLPMSLYESGESTGEISLRDLFGGASDVVGKAVSDVETIAFLACRGGWPWAVLMDDPDASLETAYDYVAAICDRDISQIDGVSRNPQHARLIIREYSRMITTQAAQSTMRKDLKGREIELSRDTVDSYIATLRRLYVIQELSAWSPSLHSKSRIAKTPTRHFANPSIAAAALGASPGSLLRDMSTLGMLFESLCVRDLRVYTQKLEGDVFHYRDESGLEADMVVSLRDGRYALFESRMSARLIDEGAANLLALSAKVDSGAMGEPAFCAVLTPGGPALRRKDGVFVIPISCLRL